MRGQVKINTGYKTIALKTLQRITEEFPELLKTEFRKGYLMHNFTHRIDTGSLLPVTCKARRLSPENYKLVEEKLNDMLDQGIIRLSNSNYTSPLHLVKKG